MSGSGCVRMGFDAATIHRTTVPFDVALLVGIGLQSLQDLGPDTRATPSHHPVKAGLEWTVAFGQIAPRSAGPVDPQNAVEDPSMVDIRMSGFAGVFGRQEGCQTLPLLVRQIATCHDCVHLHYTITQSGHELSDTL
jgi:hypothetical protein